MTRYSALALLREGLRGQTGWTRAWEDREPKAAYDVVIVGGGGHGLATAFYLAEHHGVRDVCLIEKGWIGGGNTGRNTTVIRSDYFFEPSARLYETSLRMYEGLGQELNFNVMVSQRGMLQIAHSEAEMEYRRRLANAMRLQGIDAELLDPDETFRMVPLLARGPAARWPVEGAFLQRRAGIARHDAVAWGYARAASRHGVHIVQNCEATGFVMAGDRVIGVETSKGRIGAGRVGVAVAGHSSVLAAKAGLALPIQSYALQAMVSEPLKPCLAHTVASGTVGIYLSQSDKGELVMGGHLDRQPSYAQRGSLATTRKVLAGIAELFPAFSSLRILRQWAGIVDVTPDSSPILGPTPVEGLFLNCGWGTGGFKAIPVGGLVLAHALATGRHHELSVPFGLERFETGRLIDEAAGAGIEH